MDFIRIQVQLNPLWSSSDFSFTDGRLFPPEFCSFEGMCKVQFVKNSVYCEGIEWWWRAAGQNVFKSIDYYHIRHPCKFKFHVRLFCTGFTLIWTNDIDFSLFFLCNHHNTSFISKLSFVLHQWSQAFSGHRWFFSNTGLYKAELIVQSFFFFCLQFSLTFKSKLYLHPVLNKNIFCTPDFV